MWSKSFIKILNLVLLIIFFHSAAFADSAHPNCKSFVIKLQQHPIYQNLKNEFKNTKPLCKRYRNHAQRDLTWEAKIKDILTEQIGHNVSFASVINMSKPGSVSYASLRGNERVFLASMAKVGILFSAAYSIKRGKFFPKGFEEALRFCMQPSNNSDCAQVAALLGGATLKENESELLVGGKTNSHSAKMARLNGDTKETYDNFRAQTFALLEVYGLFNPEDCSGLYPYNPHYLKSHVGFNNLPAKMGVKSNNSSQAGSLASLNCLLQGTHSGDIPFAKEINKYMKVDTQCSKDRDEPCTPNNRCFGEIRKKYPQSIFYRKTGSSAGMSGDTAFIEGPNGEKLIVTLAAKPASSLNIGQACLNIFESMSMGSKTTNTHGSGGVQ